MRWIVLALCWLAAACGSSSERSSAGAAGAGAAGAGAADGCIDIRVTPASLPADKTWGNRQTAIPGGFWKSSQGFLGLADVGDYGVFVRRVGLWAADKTPA